MAQRQLVSSGAVWEPLVGYSRAVRVGPFVSVAGTTAATADGRAVGESDIGEQTREALRRIQDALQQAGAELEHVVRTRMYVTDISRWQEVGQARRGVRQDPASHVHDRGDAAHRARAARRDRGRCHRPVADPSVGRLPAAVGGPDSSR
jgi:enamine deaminase RidA (YjgF/YER057c/UK114 family)